MVVSDALRRIGLLEGAGLGVRHFGPMCVCVRAYMRVCHCHMSMLHSVFWLRLWEYPCLHSRVVPIGCACMACHK